MESERVKEISTLKEDGYEIVPTRLANGGGTQLDETIFQDGKAGRRCLLDHPSVRDLALGILEELKGVGILPRNAIAVQAIAFDKTKEANWTVAWHQDVMFPFARPVASQGYSLGCVKGGVHYARPPVRVLEQMLAVRMHLDRSDDLNGPLKVVPGSHVHGVIATSEIAGYVARLPQVNCVVEQDELLLMRPLLLHSSSRAIEPRHRRVIHLVFHSGDSVEERWHRVLGSEY
jgi:ectoine hydroxylase-related dioxygenase (phytanoyl-CoA dioxygenase family)